MALKFGAGTHNYIAGAPLQRETFISCSHGCVHQQKINESVLNTISPWSEHALKFLKLDLGKKSEHTLALPPALHSRCLSQYVAQGIRALSIEAVYIYIILSIYKRAFFIPVFIVSISVGTHGDSTHITTELGAVSENTLEYLAYWGY